MRIRLQEVGQRLRGKSDDAEDAARRAADLRAHRVPARGDCCGGAGGATPGEADGERAPPVGAQVRPPDSAATATLVAQGTFCDALLRTVVYIYTTFSVLKNYKLFQQFYRVKLFQV